MATETEFNQFSKAIVLFAAVVLTIIFSIYFIRFNMGWDLGVLGNKNDFGSFGDFVGGVLNPILSFFTIILLLISLSIQRSELRATTKTLEQTKEVHELSLKKQHGVMLIQPCFEKFEEWKDLPKEALELTVLFSDEQSGAQMSINLANYNENKHLLEQFPISFQREKRKVLRGFFSEYHDRTIRFLDVASDLLEFGVPYYLLEEHLNQTSNNFYVTMNKIHPLLKVKEHNEYVTLYNKYFEIMQTIYRHKNRKFEAPKHLNFSEQ